MHIYIYTELYDTDINNGNSNSNTQAFFLFYLRIQRRFVYLYDELTQSISVCVNRGWKTN